MQLLLSLHTRASLIVMVMTWASLYVGWGSYMSLGSSAGDNLRYVVEKEVWCGGCCDLFPFLCSRSGVFDWLVGRQPNSSWTYQQRFIREYSGMSLRGLVWTAPLGYALQQLGFGWEFSLSGSLMGMWYFLGSKTPVSNNTEFREMFDSGIAYAEFYYGWWIWFVLSLSSLSQLVHRIRVWVHSKDNCCSYDPFSRCQTFLYLSLKWCAMRLSYEAVMLVLEAMLCCAVVFYSLVEQEDNRNKGQTFFGLFTSCLFLGLAQGWVWGAACTKRRRRKAGQVLCRQQPYSPAPEFNQAMAPGETQPLLADVDRSSPQINRNNTLFLPEGNSSPGHAAHGYPPSPVPLLVRRWCVLERYVWMDIFVVLRRVVGVIVLLSAASVLVTTILAVQQGWKTDRYLTQDCDGVF